MMGIPTRALVSVGFAACQGLRDVFSLFCGSFEIFAIEYYSNINLLYIHFAPLPFTDRVFAAEETTSQLYQSIAKPLVVSSVEGYNGMYWKLNAMRPIYLCCSIFLCCFVMCI